MKQDHIFHIGKSRTGMSIIKTQGSSYIYTCGSCSYKMSFDCDIEPDSCKCGGNFETPYCKVITSTNSTDESIEFRKIINFEELAINSMKVGRKSN